METAGFIFPAWKKLFLEVRWEPDHSSLCETWIRTQKVAQLQFHTHSIPPLHINLQSGDGTSLGPQQTNMDDGMALPLAALGKGGMRERMATWLLWGIHTWWQHKKYSLPSLRCSWSGLLRHWWHLWLELQVQLWELGSAAPSALPGYPRQEAVRAQLHQHTLKQPTEIHQVDISASTSPPSVLDQWLGLSTPFRRARAGAGEAQLATLLPSHVRQFMWMYDCFSVNWGQFLQSLPQPIDLRCYSWLLSHRHFPNGAASLDKQSCFT